MINLLEASQRPKIPAISNFTGFLDITDLYYKTIERKLSKCLKQLSPFFVTIELIPNLSAEKKFKCHSLFLNVFINKFYRVFK